MEQKTTTKKQQTKRGSFHLLPEDSDFIDYI